ncbi:MAG: hypothetical protein AAF641_14150 [Pseudomonadota bacterium]
MTLDQLLDAMFPADPARGYPCFSELKLDTSSWLDATSRNTLEALLAQDGSEKEDVNDKLKLLQSHAPEAVKSFTSAAIITYFSAPEVVRLLSGETPRHPREEIDPDLLAPVLTHNRGALNP